MKILHITESFGGGVTSAINTYVLNSHQYNHYLFASVRVNDETGEEKKGSFVDVKLVPRKLISIYNLYKYIKELNPDVIHLHSTYAGFIGRLLPFISKSKIVYTPHGFAFLRDTHPLINKFYFIIEKLLSKRTRIIAGCGADEKRLAQKFLDKQQTFELINICDELEHTSDVNVISTIPVIAMVGRVTPQKGFDFFEKVAVRCKKDANFLWIGGGDSSAVKKLTDAGVEVTGWLERSKVLVYLKNIDIYFHSAAWDGFPISVLEAAKLNKPILLREIGSFSAENLYTQANVDEVVKEILNLSSGDKKALERAHKNTLDIEHHHSKDNLIKSLSQLYSNFTTHVPVEPESGVSQSNIDEEETDNQIIIE